MTEFPPYCGLYTPDVLQSREAVRQGRPSLHFIAGESETQRLHDLSCALWLFLILMTLKVIGEATFTHRYVDMLW
jgi:hypothetical protein